MARDEERVRAASEARAALGKRIRQLRVDKEILPSALARTLGVSQPTVWAWETGRASPAVDRMPALADALGVSVEALYRPSPRQAA
jgi:transcriptional regulator with XRE-family HTH domain